MCCVFHRLNYIQIFRKIKVQFRDRTVRTFTLDLLILSIYLVGASLKPTDHKEIEK